MAEDGLTGGNAFWGLEKVCQTCRNKRQLHPTFRARVMHGSSSIQPKGSPGGPKLQKVCPGMEKLTQEVCPGRKLSHRASVDLLYRGGHSFILEPPKSTPKKYFCPHFSESRDTVTGSRDTVILASSSHVRPQKGEVVKGGLGEPPQALRDTKEHHHKESPILFGGGGGG
jgi:hypothetical protein